MFSHNQFLYLGNTGNQLPPASGPSKTHYSNGMTMIVQYHRTDYAHCILHSMRLCNDNRPKMTYSPASE
jgi:hypothetical protein